MIAVFETVDLEQSMNRLEHLHIDNDGCEEAAENSNVKGKQRDGNRGSE